MRIPASLHYRLQCLPIRILLTNDENEIFVSLTLSTSYSCFIPTTQINSTQTKKGQLDLTEYSILALY